VLSLSLFQVEFVLSNRGVIPSIRIWVVLLVKSLHDHFFDTVKHIGLFPFFLNLEPFNHNRIFEFHSQLSSIKLFLEIPLVVVIVMLFVFLVRYDIV
jgi:hypothetical protein